MHQGWPSSRYANPLRQEGQRGSHLTRQPKQLAGQSLKSDLERMALLRYVCNFQNGEQTRGLMCHAYLTQPKVAQMSTPVTLQGHQAIRTFQACSLKTLLHVPHANMWRMSLTMSLPLLHQMVRLHHYF